MISICMPFWNRRSLLLNSLRLLKEASEEYQTTDFEVILVDDASDDDQRIDDIPSLFQFAKVWRVEPEDKVWKNPAVPFNMTFKYAQGDKIIITNPECSFVGDLLGHVERQLDDKKFISFACLSFSPFETDRYFNSDQSYEAIYQRLIKYQQKINYPITAAGQLGWYNHSIYRPVGYHFCAAITRKNLLELNGFDERFSEGICFDDDDLLLRIKRKGVSIQIVDFPFTIHQYHNSHYFDNADSPGHKQFKINQALHQSILRGEVPTWGPEMKGILNGR